MKSTLQTTLCFLLLACKGTPPPPPLVQAPTAVPSRDAAGQGADSGAAFTPQRVWSTVRTRTKTADLHGMAQAAMESSDPCKEKVFAARSFAKLKEATLERTAYEAVSNTCVLYTYARVRLAESRNGASDFKGALAALDDVRPEGPLAQYGLFARAVALVGLRQFAEARAALGQLGEGYKGRNEDLQELVIGAFGDASASREEHARAYSACQALTLRHPSSAGARRVEALCTQLETQLGKDPRLGPEALADRAKAYLSEGETKRALFDADAVLKNKKASTAAVCKAASVRAQAVPKAQKQEAAAAWGEASTQCAGDEAEAQALFSGAKASVSAGLIDEALERYEQLETKFHGHRLADDARFRSALLVREKGDEAGFRARMRACAVDYPDGDMKGEALFRVALSALTLGERDVAREVLERHIDQIPDDLHWSTAGRARYFLARVLELDGKRDLAAEKYEALVRDVAPTFYSALAYSRLAELDKERAANAWTVGKKREAGASRDLYVPPPGVERAIALLEVDDVELARLEFSHLGMLGKEAPSAAVLAVAQLFDQTEQWSSAVGLYRSTFTAHASHQPEGVYRAMWEAGYPQAFGREVASAAAKDVPRSFAWSIMREESSFIPEVKSPVGAIGLMQLMPDTARTTARDTDLPFDEAALKTPEVSIALGTKLLRKLRSTYGHAALAAAAYNAGPGAVDRWRRTLPTDFDLFVESIPYEETRGYVKRVLGTFYVYATLYEPEALPEVQSLTQWKRP